MLLGYVCGVCVCVCVCVCAIFLPTFVEPASKHTCVRFVCVLPGVVLLMDEP